MDLKGRATYLVVVLTVALTSRHGGADFVESSKPPVLFCTIKSSNFGMAQMDHMKCDFLVVTDILISPDGVPLPFCNDCVYNKRAGLKVIASFGGSVVPSDLFVFLSCDDNRRSAFVNNLVEFILAHGFDGIDLSWLYPALQERDRYVRLLKELRNACDRNGLLLTVTVPSRPSVIEVNYPVGKLEKYADYVILSTTEFRKLRKTSFIAPLYPSSPGSSNNIDYHVDRWKQAGLSCGKIVIVIQTMSLTYKLYIQNEYRIGTPALQLKIRPYYKICRKLYSGSLEIWDNSAKSPYAFRDLSWYSYENEKSIKEKVGYVVQQRLGGIAVFYYDEDDPINICGDGQYPLTAIVVAAMQTEYLPPSVITDSQIYHYESPAMRSPFSPVRDGGFNVAAKHRKPDDFYAENNSDPYGQIAGAFPIDLYKRPQVPAQKMSGLEETIQTYPTSTHDASLKMLLDGILSSLEQVEHEDDSLILLNQVKLGNSVDMPAPPSDNEASAVVTDFGFPINSVQLFSENVADPNNSPLFSEQTDVQRVVYTEPCKDHRVRPSVPRFGPSLVPPAQRQQPCLPKHSGIKIFAMAHGPTTTTTTTPKPMQFYTLAPATYRPPTFCQACNSCVKLVATSGADGPVACTPPPSPPTHSPSYHAAQLYSEQLPNAAVQQPANDVRAPSMMRLQGNSVGAQQKTSFVPFEMKVCPCDGILRDPHDKRSYYLCKRGLSMCDENKFTCAHGYIFDEASKKCIAERS